MSAAIPLTRRLGSEAIGSAFLLAIIVGSGMMGERLAGGNTAIALLANSAATGAGLVALILMLGPVSAHFNPLVSMMRAWRGEFSWREIPAYAMAQISGSVMGVFAAHLMFGETLIAFSSKSRSGPSQLFSEFIATLGLLLVIDSVAKYRANAGAYAVGAYITAAYWFTASTSFANPVVTLARVMTDSFSGIRLDDAGFFIAAQCIALLVAAPLGRWLFSVDGVCNEAG